MLSYEWDTAKAASNFRKHGVGFPEAQTVFEDSGAITVEDEGRGEERYVIIGHDSGGRLLVVVFTWREQNTVRLISARRANREEALIYTEQQP